MLGVPHETDDPPAVAVAPELHGFDTAKGRLSRISGIAPLVRDEDVSDVAIPLGHGVDGLFTETTSPRGLLALYL